MRKKLNMILRRGICLSIALSMLLSGCSLFGGKEPLRETAPAEPTAPAVTETAPVEVVTAPTEAAEELSVSELLKAVLTLKGDLEDALEEIKQEELGPAEALLNGVFGKTETIRQSIRGSLTNLGDSFLSLQSQLENILGMLELVDLAADRILLPTIERIREFPLTELRVGDGMNTRLIGDYIDFAESLMPDVTILMDKAAAVDLSMVDSDGKLAGYLKTAAELLEIYDRDTEAFDRLKAIFGAEGDRLYVFAAQNSAEIRASGGFPGAVGTIRIHDGVLTLGEFDSVYDVFSYDTPWQAKVSEVEYKLFHGGLSAPRDADYCPDFERVAEIWAMGYEARKGGHVDGVISMTPAVVQRLLKAMDAEITLFDGTAVNGKNAVRTLQHDLYFKYFSTDYVADRGDISDRLFADTAQKTMGILMDNLGLSVMGEVLPIAKESFADRTMMLWMKDEAEQEILRTLHWNGGLNTDPARPQAGIYYGCTVASKMGWFLVMDAEVGDGKQNEDGSRTYPVTVTFSNDMTEEERRSASSYITGEVGGAVVGSAYFFAPAGGRVSAFASENGLAVYTETYHDLELGYTYAFNVYPNKPVSVTYLVTTAPGVDAPLELSMTPTVQAYH